MTCRRCGGSKIERWAGRIVRRDTRVPDGPCLRCMWNLFWTCYNSLSQREKFIKIMGAQR